MKKVFSVLFFFAAFAALLAFSHYSDHILNGLACMAMVPPIMPRNLWGKPMLQRDIGLNTGTFNMEGEALRYPVYDRLRMDSAQLTNDRSLFKTAVGGQRENITLSYADTNIQQSEQVPSTQKWQFDRLELKYLASAARTDALIQSSLDYVRNTYFGLKINSKDYMFILPLWKFFGTPQMVTAPAATINSDSPKGVWTGIWEFSDVPIVLQAGTNWGVVVTPLVASAAGLNGDYIGFEFGSLRARAG